MYKSRPVRCLAKFDAEYFTGVDSRFEILVAQDKFFWITAPIRIATQPSQNNRHRTMGTFVRSLSGLGGTPLPYFNLEGGVMVEDAQIVAKRSEERRVG